MAKANAGTVTKYKKNTSTKANGHIKCGQKIVFFAEETLVTVWYLIDVINFTETAWCVRQCVRVCMHVHASVCVCVYLCACMCAVSVCVYEENLTGYSENNYS